MSHWYKLYCQKCINVHNYAEHAVIKLMHVQLPSCAMTVDDAYAVIILVQQSQYHVNFDRQTGQLLPRCILRSSTERGMSIYGTKAMPERGAFTHALVVVIRRRLKILIRSFIFQVLHFLVPQIPVHIFPPLSRSCIFHPGLRTHG